MSQFVTVLLALVVAVSALPTRVEERTAESLLAQIYQVEEDPSPDTGVVSILKGQITSDIKSVEIKDDSDRLTLPTQLLDAQQHEQYVENLLANSTAEAAERATQESSIQSQCERLALTLDAAKIVMDTAQAAVAQEDDIVLREQVQFNASVDAIDRDLKVLDALERKLRDVVELGSKRASIEPQALLHQVSVLVQNMRQELLDSKANAHIEWDLTKQRLDLEARPTRNRLELAKANVTAAMSSVHQCSQSLTHAHNETVQADATVERLTGEVVQVKAEVEGIQTTFNERHTAREKRIKFLSGVLRKLDELNTKSTALPTTVLAPAP